MWYTRKINMQFFFQIVMLYMQTHSATRGSKYILSYYYWDEFANSIHLLHHSAAQWRNYVFSQKAKILSHAKCIFITSIPIYLLIYSNHYSRGKKVLMPVSTTAHQFTLSITICFNCNLWVSDGNLSSFCWLCLMGQTQHIYCFIHYSLVLVI